MTDTSIYSRFMPREMSMQDYLDEQDARDQKVMQNKLNGLMLQDKQRGFDESNQLRALYAQPGFDPSTPDGLRRVMGVSPTQGIALQKSILDTQKTRGDIAKNDAETQSKLFGLAENRYKAWQTNMGALAQHPDLTKDLALQTGQQLVRMGVMSPEMFQSAASDLPDDPEQLRQKILTGLKTQMTPEQMFTTFAPKVSTVDNGQQITRVDDNPNSPTFGKQVGAPAVQKLQDPNSVASVGASLANARATRDVAQATRDAANIQSGFQNETALRKEFEGLPEVKNYKQAFPAFAAVKDAVSRNTPQSDINIVYGIAKLYDPNSVVREGEYATVANSPSIPEKIKGYAQFLQGGGRLSLGTKEQLLQEAQGRLGTYKAEVDKALGSYEQIARRRNIDPGSVFQDMGDMGGASNLRGAAAAELARRKGGK